MSVVRIWRGRAAAASAGAYRAHLEQSVLPALRAAAGFEGVELFERLEAGEVEILVLTRWSSTDAIRAFAGDDLEKAVVEPQARAVLSGWDDAVRHFEVALEARA